MLKLASQMDEQTRWTCLIWHWVAVDEDFHNGRPTTYLVRSEGRRIAGRPTRYTLVTPNKQRRFQAFSDEDAVAIANQKIGQ